MMQSKCPASYAQYNPSRFCSSSLNATVVGTLALVMFFSCFFASLTARAELTVEELLGALSLSKSQKQDIWKGKVVEFSAPETSRRGLPIGLVLLGRENPDKYIELFREAVVYKAFSMVTKFGQLSSQGSLADFAGVVLEPNGIQEARRYLEGKPGNELNLGTKERAAFQKLKTDGDRQKKVEKILRSTLLTRYQDYRARGLAGMAPYDRGRGRLFDPGAELRKRIEASRFTPKFAPTFYNFLLNYPTGIPEGLEEKFYWVNFKVFGRPTFALSHRVSYKHEDMYFMAERHFYASHDYNSLQMTGALLPTQEGTLGVVFYRVSTDQVAGFGSSVKRPVAQRLMRGPLADLVKKLRALGEKK